MNSTDTINKNKIQTRNSLSLRLRLIFAIIIFLFIIAFIVSIYLITKKERRENVIIESESLLAGLSDGIYSDIQRYRELSRLVMIDDRLVKFLRAKTEDVSPGLINTARYGVLGVLNVTTMVDSIFVFRNDGQYMATNRGKYMLNYIRMDDDDRIQDFIEKPVVAQYRTISCGIYVIRRRLLIELLERSREENRYDFVQDILIRYRGLKRIYGYRMEDYWSNIASVEDYFRTNMDFLKPEIRDYFFRQYPEVHSRAADLPPAKYNIGVKIKNSLLSSGCIVNGTVENSILCREFYTVPAGICW